MRAPLQITENGYFIDERHEFFVSKLNSNHRAALKLLFKTDVCSEIIDKQYVKGLQETLLNSMTMEMLALFDKKAFVGFLIFESMQDGEDNENYSGGGGGGGFAQNSGFQQQNCKYQLCEELCLEGQHIPYVKIHLICTISEKGRRRGTQLVDALINPEFEFIEPDTAYLELDSLAHVVPFYLNLQFRAVIAPHFRKQFGAPILEIKKDYTPEDLEVYKSMMKNFGDRPIAKGGSKTWNTGYKMLRRLPLC
jgi:hypothetical protein